MQGRFFVSAEKDGMLILNDASIREGDFTLPGAEERALCAAERRIVEKSEPMF